MSEHRVIFIENAAQLSIDNSRIKIVVYDKQEPVFILPKDIAVLFLHHPVISVTQAVLLAMAETGGVVLVTDKRHMPVAMQLPLAANVKLVSRLHQQIKLQESNIHKECWRQIVQSRISSQAYLLEQNAREGVKLLQRLAAKVEPDDISNIESQAARHYWRYWLDKPHKRIKKGADDNINVALNFGYAIVRSLVARAITAAGLNPSLGIHHRNKENHYNLADDLMEPFRFLVEDHILNDLPDSNMNSNRKASLAQVIQKKLIIQGNEYRLPIAIQELVDSYVRVLESNKQAKLKLPMLE